MPSLIQTVWLKVELRHERYITVTVHSFDIFFTALILGSPIVRGLFTKVTQLHFLSNNSI